MKIKALSVCISLAALAGCQSMPQLSDVTTSTYMEAKAAAVAPFGKPREIDSTISTAYASAEYEISPRATAFGSVMYKGVVGDEVFEDGAAIDELYVDFAPNKFASFRLGQSAIEFGARPDKAVMESISTLVSDASLPSLTVSFGKGLNGPEFTTYVFDSQTDISEGKSGVAYGARMAYNFSDKNKSFTTALDYNSSLFDSRRMNDFAETNNLVFADTYPVAAVSAKYHGKDWDVLWTYSEVLDPIAEVPFELVGAIPEIAGTELWFGVNDLMKGGAISIRAEATKEAVNIDLPKQRFALGISQEDMKEAWIWGVEAFHDKDYDLIEGGTEETRAGVAVKFGLWL